MSFSRFTDRARKVAALSQDTAIDTQSEAIGSEHLLLALVKEGGGVAYRALEEFGASYDAFKDIVLSANINGKENSKGKKRNSNQPLSFNKDGNKIISQANIVAVREGSLSVGTEHLLLAILEAENSMAYALLVHVRINPTALQARVKDILDEGVSPHPSSGYSESESPSESHLPPEDALAGGSRFRSHRQSPSILDSFAHNMTQDAKDGRLDPVIGRESEIERLMQILGRRTKNNPVIIGEPGVGKTAILEGLAQKIASGSVPETLKDMQIYSLDLASMLAGTRFRGDFEERLKKTIKDVQTRGNIILFLDEMHVIAGAGGSGEGGGTDAANILKPLLARGELRLIGATTLDEYRKYIEKDAALERRFQPIQVSPPTEEQTIAILNGLRDRYARHHGVKFSDEALVAAVSLSNRYIPDRNLPDKAIDILDEAGARAQMQRFTKSPEITEIDKQVLEIRQSKENAVAQQDFEKAAELRKDEFNLNEAKAKAVRENRKTNTSIVVSAEMIADVVTAITGIPVGKINDKDNVALLKIEENLHSRVIGQDQAIAALSRAIRRTKAGLKDPSRPSGSFIFAGPTGVGKTELAKALAEFLHGNEEALITLDMSEYAEKQSVSRLFGAPPGYVGYDEGGQLTEKVRRKPFSVVLFDEMEKAHPDLANTLLQVLDEGQLTDSQGRVIDFKNTVIIMTTNLGSRDVAKGNYVGFGSIDSESGYERTKKKVHDELKQFFRPEFLNRVDDIIVFKTLTMSEIIEIVDIMVESLNKRLSTQDMELEVTLKAKEYLAQVGYDQAMGARPLRRVVQQKLEDALSERILSGSINKGDLMLADYDQTINGLTFVTHPKSEISFDAVDGQFFGQV